MSKRKYAVKPEVVKLVRKVQNHILEEPKRFNMDDWVEHISEDLSSDDLYGSSPEIVAAHNKEMKKLYPACGTTACIAGWVAILSKPLKTDKDGYLVIPKVNDIAGFARKKLGLKDFEYTLARLDLDGKEADALALDSPDYHGPAFDDHIFFVNKWPQPFRSKYANESEKPKPSKLKLAKIAVARLDHFLTTGC